MFKGATQAPALCAVLLLSSCAPRLPERPSIVVIVIDDLGAHDLGSYGHPYHRTPSIDRLAAEGLRFTRAYAAAPVCAPTRAALLTGKSPARLHLTHALPPLPSPLPALPATVSGPPSQKLTEPQSATWLDGAEVTIAERLRRHGYRTAIIGKWHLGRAGSGPSEQGFEVAIGGEEEAAPASFFSPYGLPRLPDGAPGEYLTDRLTDEALAFLDRSGGAPFLLVLSHFAVHAPIQASAESVREWRERIGRRPGGATAARSLAPEYAAMLESVDRSVERILLKLGELGIERETLVVLTSDNGGVMRTPDTGQEVTSNGPLRGEKGTLYEGGLRVPLVVRWPAVIGAGRETEALTGAADWYPTLLDVAGAAGAEAIDGAALDGESLLPVLRGGGRRERALHFFYPHYIAGYRSNPALETYWNTPGAAIRSGNMKLIHRFEGSDELYDLDADPREADDLHGERPDVAARLRGELDGWLESEGAHLPRPNQGYDSGAFRRDLERRVAALGGASDWTPNGDCTTRVEHGQLALDCASTPFIVGPEMIVEGPLRVVVRFRATGTRGAPALWYSAVDKPAFSGDRRALTPAAEPGVHESVIEREGTIRQLRIDFGRARGGHVEVDWIRLLHGRGEEKTLVEWSFDRTEAQAHAD
jgi:arylsulfatase A-like enzyme